MAYQIVIAESVSGQVAALRADQRARIIDAVERLLAQQPTTETRNRKLLRPNPLATWELRVGALRIFYDVEPNTGSDPDRIRVLAVGVKRGNVLLIAGKRVNL